MNLKIVALLLLAAYTTGYTQYKNQRIKVSENKRFLVHDDGTPFFYLADTGWELFHRLDRENAEKYLKKRAEQGFTAIQAVVLAEENGLIDPNPYGEVPFYDLDPTKPNEKYFEHVDYIINTAAKYGIVIALLPTWGDKIDKMQWGQGPVVFTPENARVYGEWLGKRYQNTKNIIWVIGGDRAPEPTHKTIYRAMAQGIINGVGKREHTLFTFHPPGGRASSEYFHADDWLDFNMLQTGHCRDVNVYERIQKDYMLAPTKPTMDGEPIYEEHPVCFNARDHGYSTATDVRKSAYWGVFAGGHGHTYGCHSVWQMYSPDKNPVNNPRQAWYDALDLPGANQMKHLKQLMLSKPYLTRVPKQDILAFQQTPGAEYVVATGNADGSYALVYLPVGKAINIDTQKLKGALLRTTWFNPRTGEYTQASIIPKKGIKTFTPPALGINNDWVLVLESEGTK